MKKKSLSAFVLASGLMMLMFQNCSRVNFVDMKSSIAEKGQGTEMGEVENQEPVQTPIAVGEPNGSNPVGTEQQIVEGVISRNAACNLVAGQDQQARDFEAHGNLDKVAVANAAGVLISGNIGSVSVNGAKEVDVHGNISALCIRAERINQVSGNLARSTSPVVLIGSGAGGSMDQISGNISGDLLVENMSVSGQITGNSKDIYISGGKVGSIHGNGGNLYLLQNTDVGHLTGNYKTIYLSKTARIGKMSGNFQIKEL